MLKTIEVCAGIGGITLGFELAGGFEPVAFIEWDDYANSILEKHWPDVPRFRDLRRTCARELPRCDVLAGGIPCQPHSLAGRRGASADSRDLWPDMFRLVCNLRPRYVLVENVPGLRSSESGRFFGRILRDLAALGYCTEWIGLSAGEVGAPHERDRVWIVAYPDRQRQPQPQGAEQGQWRWSGNGSHQGRAWAMANPERQGLALGQSVGRSLQQEQPAAQRGGAARVIPDAGGQQHDRAGRLGSRGRTKSTNGSRWPAQSGLGGAVDGLSPWLAGWDDGIARTTTGYPGRVDQLRCLGNAVVPWCARVIGRAIYAHYLRSL